MAIYCVNHRVQDFTEWKKTYDEHQPWIREQGVKDHFVLQSLDDPNHVVVIGEGSVEDLQALMASDDLKAAMAEAGVVGAPDIFIGEDRSQGI